MMNANRDQDDSWERDTMSISQRCRGPRDPLGEVIDWLDHAELTDEIIEASSLGNCDGGQPGVHNLFRDDSSSSSQWGGAQPMPVSKEGRIPEYKPPPARQRGRAAGGCCWPERHSRARNLSPMDDEDEEWETRQKQTGAAGRLVVYDQGDHPRDDVLLRGGCGRRLMVTAVTEGGKAAKAGVKAGDILVSINGKKGFGDKSADEIHASLLAPVILVFMGFVGKLQAEVRLNYSEKICGMSTQQQVISGRPDTTVHVLEEVVFQPSAALFLTTTVPPKKNMRVAERSWGSQLSPQIQSVNTELVDVDGFGGGRASGSRAPPREEAIADAEPSRGSTQVDELSVDISMVDCVQDLGKAVEVSPLPSAVYELRVTEARRIVERALNSNSKPLVGTIAGDTEKVESPFNDTCRSPAAKPSDEPAPPIQTDMDRAQAPRAEPISSSPFVARYGPGPTQPMDMLPVKPTGSFGDVDRHAVLDGCEDDELDLDVM